MHYWTLAIYLLASGAVKLKIYLISSVIQKLYYVLSSFLSVLESARSSLGDFDN